MLEDIFDRYKDRKGNLISLLQAVQGRYGYLAAEALDEISRRFRIPRSEIHSVATFYTQFRFNKPGRHHIKVCHGTACHINGAVRISETIEKRLGVVPGRTTGDGLFSLENVACLGCCSLSPVIMIAEKVHGKLDAAKTEKIIAAAAKS